MKTEEFRDILYEKEEATGIVTVTLNQPQRKNAMSSLTFLELFWAVEHLDSDESALAMVITGAVDPEKNDPENEAFSSGGYFSPRAFEGMSDEIKAQIDFQDIAQKKLSERFWRLEKPVIAAINGLAIGAGFTMPFLCADLIYASEHAWARLPFVQLGIVPEFAMTLVLPRLMGFQKAKEIMYFGETIPAQELVDLGLINKVVAHGQLLDYAKQMALKLIPPGGAGMAVKLTKRAIHKPLVDRVAGALDEENFGLNKAVASEDFFEVLAAKQQKREAVYKGK
jgi:2-(1,2-epoxy-1,2-dihydrophenyl)acetyl-CoA isomerase